MRSDYEESGPAIAVFAGINIALASLCFLGTLFCMLILGYGVFVSGDKGRELASGVIGILVIAFPMLLGNVIYLVAAVGLVRRRVWGYYLHIVGAVLAGFTCIGVVYTVLALVWAIRPEFSASFFNPTEMIQDASRGFYSNDAES